MSLVLEIEYLLGTCFAAIGPDSEIPDWPPQPDRVFSALVATWGAHGEKKEEEDALKWLEVQPPPRIEASEHSPRNVPTCFVPPNDSETGRSGDRSVLPAYRRRQARRFPATRPNVAVVRLHWTEAEPDEEILAALHRLALDTAYIGHSSSLTRCHFSRTNVISGATLAPARRVYPGRLAELKKSFSVFVASGGARGRPLNGALVKQEPSPYKKLPHAFEKRWLLLESISESVPDIRASTIVAKVIRDALLSGYKQIGLENDIPEVVSGHAHDDSPSRIPHVAIVPLAFVGFPHADGHLMGFAIVPPRDSSILDDPIFRRALRAVAPLNEDFGRRILTLNPRSLRFTPTFEAPPGKRSLDPVSYTKPSRTFASVTPVVLDRHLKEKGTARTEEIAERITAACRNIGLPEPEAIVPDKHTGVEGAPSAYTSGRSPMWMQWRLPQVFSSRQLTHALIRFPEPVQGPVLLGAG